MVHHNLLKEVLEGHVGQHCLSPCSLGYRIVQWLVTLIEFNGVEAKYSIYHLFPLRNGLQGFLDATHIPFPSGLSSPPSTFLPWRDRLTHVPFSSVKSSRRMSVVRLDDRDPSISYTPPGNWGKSGSILESDVTTSYTLIAGSTVKIPFTGMATLPYSKETIY